MSTDLNPGSVSGESGGTDEADIGKLRDAIWNGIYACEAGGRRADAAREKGRLALDSLLTLARSASLGGASSGSTGEPSDVLGGTLSEERLSDEVEEYAIAVAGLQRNGNKLDDWWTQAGEDAARAKLDAARSRLLAALRSSQEREQRLTRHIGSWRDLGRVALDEYAAAEREVTRLRAELSALREQAARWQFVAPRLWIRSQRTMSGATAAFLEVQIAMGRMTSVSSAEWITKQPELDAAIDQEIAARAALSEPTRSTTGTNAGPVEGSRNG